MVDVFISYKSERRKAAAHLAKILECYGYTVWYDYSLVKGRDFAAQIDAKIREAKAVVVLWCSKSVRSEWVADEAALAAKLGILVPAKIEPCELRVDFDRKDTIDLTGWGGAPRDHALDVLLAALVEKVRRALQQNFRAITEYEEVWRRFGAPSLKAFALNAPVHADLESSVAPDPSTLGPAERDWEHARKKRSGTSNLTPNVWVLTALIAAVAGAFVWQTQTDVVAPPKPMPAPQESAGDACGGVLVSMAMPGEKPCIKPGSGKSFKDCPDCPEMVIVPSGNFTIGSPEDERRRSDNEGPQHEVTIAKPFAVGRYAVTFADWDACLAAGGCGGYSPGDAGWGRGNRPVINVSWNSAKAYVSWLSKKTGKSYRLLSEAEREYVARAGAKTPFWWGDSVTPDQANYNGGADPYWGGGKKGNYREKTLPVTSFEPNAWGLYQVHGNIWEWVEDCWVFV